MKRKANSPATMLRIASINGSLATFFKDFPFPVATQSGLLDGNP